MLVRETSFRSRNVIIELHILADDPRARQQSKVTVDLTVEHGQIRSR